MLLSTSDTVLTLVKFAPNFLNWIFHILYSWLPPFLCILSISSPVWPSMSCIVLLPQLFHLFAYYLSSSKQDKWQGEIKSNEKIKKKRSASNNSPTSDGEWFLLRVYGVGIHQIQVYTNDSQLWPTIFQTFFLLGECYVIFYLSCGQGESVMF